MRRFVFLILLLVTIQLRAQEKSWRLGIMAMPEMVFSNSELRFTEYEGYELQKGAFNITTGISVQRKINNFTLISGVNYAQKDVRGLYYCHVCDLGYVLESRVSIRYIEIPLIARYIITNGDKWNVHGQIGGSLVRFLRNPSVYKLGSVLHNFPIVNDQLKQFAFTGNIGVGVNYEISKRLNWETTIVYEQSFAKGDNFNYNGIGLALGVNYEF